MTTIKICDVGGTYRFWFIFPFEKFEEIKFQITLINLQEIVSSEEENYKNIIQHKNVSFSQEIGSGYDLNHIKSDFYDLSHSNSVVEHVGDWKNIKSFMYEVIRVGKYHFIPTPKLLVPCRTSLFFTISPLFPKTYSH